MFVKYYHYREENSFQNRNLHFAEFIDVKLCCLPSYLNHTVFHSSTSNSRMRHVTKVQNHSIWQVLLTDKKEETVLQV